MKRLNCRLMDTLNEYFAVIINFIVAIINVYSGIIGDEQCVLSMKSIRKSTKIRSRILPGAFPELPGAARNEFH